MAKKDLRTNQFNEDLLDDYSLDINFSYPSREDAKAALLPKINEFLNQDNTLDKDSEADFLLGEIRDFIDENIKYLNKQKSDMALTLKKTNIKNDRAIERCQEELDQIAIEILTLQNKKTESFFTKIKAWFKSWFGK
ncbi:hypothetical protein [Anaerococcus sp. Marseille-P9784]|uniref:hypothetical protein n=1 Tax=Anaerococcus sp. Marseille-P9784 TaxID=2614127 RepID=UPI00124A4586|nr:hypothetical protein [Anaerococcus sp. Marseille-P9784]